MDAISLHPGDLLRVERRFLVDGVVTTALSEGRFAGVRVLGTSEHLALEGGGEEVKLIPLTAVSEITIVQSAPR
ncbi:MAG TPA: hypothetical protein VHH36_01405, partial [Candidatus Thermoplasmatota archaeon]|nr:hypothetical protein [Candidatus Thermoplasmatota archaeon]